jgi:hypothetical protein
MKLFAAFLTAGFLLAGGDPKGPAKGEGADKFVRIEATAYLDRESVTKAVGGPLDQGIVVLEVKVTPADGKKLSLNLDDFLLRSDRSGERSTPYTPSQIAGSSTMRVSSQAVSVGGVQSQNTGPVWGGMGGRGSRMPGSGQAMGNGTAQVTEATASVDENSGQQKENPMLAVLKEKILPEKEIAGPVSGQLYFLMEGKQKVKDIELLYKTAAGRVSVRFKQQP